MKKSKHRMNADVLITDYIEQQADFAQAICEKLRTIILGIDSAIIEDWKWGPNYYCNGMVCGFGAFQKHVNLVFFQGVLLKDDTNILIANPGNIHNRHLRFTTVSQVKSQIIRKLIKEAIKNNRQGKIVESEIKEIEIPQQLKFILQKHKLLTKFNKLTFYKRKEFINWFLAAKREETRENRLEKIVEMVVNDTFLY